MAADLAISITAKLIEVIGSEIVKEICDIWGYKSQLEELKETVFTIKMVLLDADTKRELSNQDRDYIEKLKEAVYDADDLFDEFVTLAELNQLGKLSKRVKFVEKVRCFFSSKNQVGHAYRMSREVKDIKERLDVIASNHTKFRFDVDYKPIIRREETSSYVDVKEIIGREEDKKAIIDMLLDSNCKEDYSFLTIVGVGGLGKTALAQLVYNDEKVKEEFSMLRLWVCVSDQDGEQFDLKSILCKIIELITEKKFDSSCSFELVQNQFEEQLRGQKYLLVLDDIWDEDREKWLDLKKFLKLGRGGSKIVVTTRSEVTATMIGGEFIYKLEGLSVENSWRLFEMVALNKRHEQGNLDEFIEIGNKIVEKCCNNPLALRVVGSLLYSQDISKWQLFEEIGLANIGQGDNKIISILKLSYHNLKSSLKSCFSYCAIFPKDFVIEKDMLIGLWMAQEYIVPFDRGQSIEDAAEEHFLILLRRCFFQDVEKNDYGEVETVKIHDLMHDVAQEVRREEIRVVTSIANNLGDKIRHVNYVGDEIPESSICNRKTRSYICRDLEDSQFDINIDDWMRLRALDLSFMFRGLPKSIGKMLHLRYLNLASNEDIDILPDSITQLHNLQTLVLRGCTNLSELPEDLDKLVKLRHLDLTDCKQLTCMPSNMNKMTSLTMLTMFVVGMRKSTDTQSDDELKGLKVLSNIKGNIRIKIGESYRNMEDMNIEEGYLESMKNLKKVSIAFQCEDEYAIFDEDEHCESHEGTLEKLKPPRNLKVFTMYNYSGATIPRWGRAEDNWAILLPNLVDIRLYFCMNLDQIPVLSKLPFLKSLSLEWLPKIEYMENAETAESSVFFPLLESLEMKYLVTLKGWWKENELVDQFRSKLRFPRLCKLTIGMCRNLTSFPRCPSLEDMHLFGVNETLHIIECDTDESSEDETDETSEDEN